MGSGSGCEGHLGCNYTWNQEMVNAEAKKWDDALETCKSVDTKLHLGIFLSNSNRTKNPCITDQTNMCGGITE
ncbi:MAG: hypothetical protein ACXVBQ_17365 [Pseudobdellovibrionaceae bacterium]